MSISVRDPILSPLYPTLATTATTSGTTSSSVSLSTGGTAVQSSSALVSLSSDALKLSSTPSEPVSVTIRPISFQSTSSLISIVANPLQLASLDITAPTVTNFSPADGSRSAATNAKIALTFSENIVRGTGTIVLKNSAGEVIESFDAATSTNLAISGNGLTLKPTKDLAANTQYFVSFAIGTLKDLAGNKYAGTTTYDFRTGADNIAPTVTAFSPADGSKGAATNANIVLKFSEDIKLGKGTIVLKNSAGKVIESFDASNSANISIDGNQLTLNPTKDLAGNTKFFVTFAPGSIKDLTGNSYKGTTSYDFKTGADKLAPTVTAFSPADGSTGAATNANIVLKFSEDIKLGKGTIVLKNSAGKVIESFDASNSANISIDGNQLTLNPTKDLAGNTKFFVTFEAGSVKDLAGNSYKGTKTYDFKTGADKLAPTVTAFTPADGSTGVLSNADIALTFSEDIKLGKGAIVLKNSAGKIIETFDAATSQNISISGNGLTLNPTKDLAANTKYVVTFAAGTITDRAGNKYTGTKTFDFKTGTDKIAPTVTAFSPADGATGAATHADIALAFSEDIKRGKGAIVLKNSAGKIIETFDAATSQNISISGNSLKINPSQDLAANTSYFLTFAAGTITDLSYNKFTGTTTYDFKTGATTVASTPTTSTPAGYFNIDLIYSGDSTYQTYFDQAKTFWEKVIIGDLPSANGIDDLRITAEVKYIDGAYGVLGQASPTLLRGDSRLPIEGTMSFDTADMATMVTNGTLLRVVMHEMGHVLGLGSLWSTFGFNSTVGQYTGAAGVAMYRQISGLSGASYVPLETSGGSGTANVHWSEAVFDRELMTGFAESNSNMPVSKLTIAALEDLGYQVNYAAAEAYTVV